MVILAAEVHIYYMLLIFHVIFFFLYTNFIHVADFPMMKYVDTFFFIQNGKNRTSKRSITSLSNLGFGGSGIVQWWSFSVWGKKLSRVTALHSAFYPMSVFFCLYIFNLRFILGRFVD